MKFTSATVLSALLFALTATAAPQADASNTAPSGITGTLASVTSRIGSLTSQSSSTTSGASSQITDSSSSGSLSASASGSSSSLGIIGSITSAVLPSSTGSSNGALATGFAKQEGLAIGLGAGLLAAALL